MNKSELVNAVAERGGQTKKIAEQMIDATFEVITEALAGGDKVSLVGFGNFEAKKRAARKGRNPKTKEEIDIPASTVPSFKPGKSLKEAVNK